MLSPLLIAWSALCAVLCLGAAAKVSSNDLSVSQREMLEDIDRVMHPLQPGIRHYSRFAKDDRLAIVVTLAGNRKLAPYFEWSCRSIGASKKIADLLVFHENNQELTHVQCAPNVKFFNLGNRGLSDLIARQIMGNATREDVIGQLSLVVNNVLLHMPKYLVEVKPMTGSMFATYLTPYSHWTYSDPDIIWGDLTQWITRQDLKEFDVLSLTRHFDAGRLFLRGQFALHKNKEPLNSLWKKLSYLQQESFASRLGAAYRMLLDKVPSDAVFRAQLHSAEGWYSHLMFAEDNVKLKLYGAAFDDFFREPVVVISGHLARCDSRTSLTECIDIVSANLANHTRVSALPNPQVGEVKATKHVSACKMQWLPEETRVCLAETVYDKTEAIAQDAQSDVKLLRIGEAMLAKGKWVANDEIDSPRQLSNWGAFFHFRHWDEYIAMGHQAHWAADPLDLSCMIMYLKYNRKLAFEDCAHVREEEKLRKRVVLHDKVETVEGPLSVKEVLAHHRAEIDLGHRVRSKTHSDTGDGADSKGSSKEFQKNRSNAAAAAARHRKRKQKSDKQ